MDFFQNFDFWTTLGQEKGAHQCVHTITFGITFGLESCRTPAPNHAFPSDLDLPCPSLCAQVQLEGVANSRVDKNGSEVLKCRF